MKNEFFKRILSSIIIIPIALFFIIKGSFYFSFFLLGVFMFVLYEWKKISKKKFYREFGIIFLFFTFFTAYSLRGSTNVELWNFLLILLICVSTDVGGYIFGKILKGPKLTKISPKKTVAGMFGGFLLSIIFVNIYLNYLSSIEKSNKLFQINSENDLILVLSVSLVSQAGDIFVSYFKRKSKIKNTSNLIPGHGGLLDRIDGIIFAVPFSYLIFKFII